MLLSKGKKVLRLITCNHVQCNNDLKPPKEGNRKWKKKTNIYKHEKWNKLRDVS